MKTCTNCGWQMDDQSPFCTNCGTAAAPAQQAPVAPAAAPAAKKFSMDKVNLDAVKKVNKKTWIAIGAGVLAVILAIVLLVAFLPNYKTPIKLYTKYATGRASSGDLKNMAPKEVWEKIEEQYDVTQKEMLEFYKEHKEDIAEGAIEEYGENVKGKVKVTEKDETKKSEFKDMKEYLTETYDLKSKDIKKALDLEGEITWKGKDDKDEEEFEATVIKIGGKWYFTGNFAQLEGLAMLTKMDKNGNDPFENSSDDDDYGDYGDYEEYYGY